jgi:hypothetical protein
MSVKVAKCEDCGLFPDNYWMLQGGKTDANIWTTTGVCRDCWAKFVKKCDISLEAEMRATACDGGYRYEF